MMNLEETQIHSLRRNELLTLKASALITATVAIQFESLVNLQVSDFTGDLSIGNPDRKLKLHEKRM